MISKGDGVSNSEIPMGPARKMKKKASSQSDQCESPLAIWTTSYDDFYHKCNIVGRWLAI